MKVDIDRLVETAKTYQGVPYHHQGRNKFGLDCVGLGIVCLQEQGIDTKSPTDYSRYPDGKSLLFSILGTNLLYETNSLEFAKGDILVFRIRRDPQHVAIAIDDHNFIHASYPIVSIIPFEGLWEPRLISVMKWKNNE